MKTVTLALRIALVALVALLAIAPSTIDAQQPDRDALRARIQARYDVVPISGGIALTPKTRRGDVRLIEVSDVIAINGAFVSGRELRERLGEDADEILQLSYLDNAARLEMFPKPEPVAPPQEVRPERREAPETTPRAESTETRRRSRSFGDRVKVFGSVRVGADEEVNGQAVAVFGSVRVDGVVRDQVVAVFGSVDLGPDAVVHGDVVSVGGQVRKATTAEVRGGTTEVAVGHVDIPHDAVPWMAGVGLLSLGDSFSGVPRLIASTFRLMVLIILAALAYTISRRSVENAAERVRENPARAALIGLASGLLIGPLLFIISIVLILTFIGIPLLLLIPVLMIFLVFMGLAGFSGSAYAIGQWANRRFGIGSGTGVLSVVVGVCVILLPVMVARIVGLGGWMTSPFTWTIAALAFFFEAAVWCAGFGAVLSNTVAGWQARRAARAMPAPTPAP